MKIILAAILLISSSAFAGEMFISENYSIKIDLSNSAPAIDNTNSSDAACLSCEHKIKNAWTTEDTYREVAFLTLLVIDYGQTSTIAQHPEFYKESVSAWAIGEHPSQETVNTYFSIVAIAHYGIARKLDADWRKAFQYLTIGEKIPAVVGNATIGIRMSF
ncbi:MAG: hypothetical protein WC236_15810 [Gallionellaceae bacterium]|jgi:hypothetical protein